MEILIKEVEQVDDSADSERKFFEKLLRRHFKYASKDNSDNSTKSSEQVTLLKYLLEEFENKHEDLDKKVGDKSQNQAYNYSERSESGIMLTHLVESLLDHKYKLGEDDHEAIKNSFWKLLRHKYE